MKIIKKIEPNRLQFKYIDNKYNEHFMLECELTNKNELIYIREKLLINGKYEDMGVPHNNISAKEKGTTLTNVLGILLKNYAATTKLVSVTMIMGEN